MTNNTQTQGARLNPDALNAAILALDAPTALCIAGAGAASLGIAAGLADVAAGAR